MNAKRRNDIILVLVALIVLGAAYWWLSRTPDGDFVATIYYMGDEIYQVDLSTLPEDDQLLPIIIVDPKERNKDNVHFFEDLNQLNQYVSELTTSDYILFSAKRNAIRVAQEESRYNICSVQGYSGSPYRPIICLPNFVEIIIGEPGDLISG